jgi:hypothetical protein
MTWISYDQLPLTLNERAVCVLCREMPSVAGPDEVRAKQDRGHTGFRAADYCTSYTRDTHNRLALTCRHGSRQL